MVLDNVDFTTTGQYRCEVSGDAPMFQTASTEGILYVVGKYLSLKTCLYKLGPCDLQFNSHLRGTKIATTHGYVSTLLGYSIPSRIVKVSYVLHLLSP